ncbi:class I SAM-dependent methyltransferase [Methanobacterium ferruginis]|uniref:class I SAM-dependent methyltransferase n=1 Tax=Methanobacterium ferruginis TaxID=710191 RepID=UPI00257220FF|nr:class I SAM-dependent methyltransferase [Methanobacterium ferruginis]BDZ69001.1 hypothetical protein GCM10025860_24490 [Methanobacterium ferruginis]
MKFVEIYRNNLNKLKKQLFNLNITRKICVFNLLESLGYHITKNHYYSPIPDKRLLGEDLWAKKSKLIGITINEELMIDLLKKFGNNYKDEYELICDNKFFHDNSFFESLDAEIYYCMVRNFVPKKIIEVGAGFSTYLSALAILKNKEEHDVDGELIAIEPYPGKELVKGFDGLSKLVKSKVQSVDISEFTKLEKNDILFIDSSHVVKTGGDVVYLILEILPRLKPGVIVHIHDIFIPYEYPEEWLMNLHRFWNEQYLIQSFLLFNNEFEILWGSSYMNMSHPEKLKYAFDSYENYSRWPSSFWIRRI